MRIIPNREMCICTTDVRGINCRELRQMHELNSRIQSVLESHKPESKEKKYISDDDLLLMHAILSVFTKDFVDTQTSEFDKFLKEDKTNAHTNTTIVSASGPRESVYENTEVLCINQKAHEAHTARAWEHNNCCIEG